MHAVVTGASRGIGKAIVLALAEAGYTLSCCSRNSDNLEALKKEAAAVSSKEIRTLSCDVSDRAALDRFAQFVLEGPDPTVLVNNAGVFLPGNVHDEPEGNLEQMMRTNVYSAYHLSRALVPAMMKQGSGHIFNICSVASLKAYPNGGSYSISKFAMLGFSQNLRLELQDKGVRVTAILPGAVLTDSWAGVELPPERLMPPEDIASAVMNCLNMSPRTVVEDVILRPQLGDL